MDLLAAIRIAIRRWYILIPLVMLSMLGSLAVRDQVQPSYKIQGILPVVVPYVSTREASSQLYRNNFVDLGGTSAIIATLGDSPEVRRAVEERGGDPQYVIGSASGTVIVKISTDSVERALATYRFVREELGVRLDALQRTTGVPAAYRVTISDALAPTGGRASVTGRTRAVIASFGLGLVLSFATCVFIDYLLSRRRRSPSPKAVLVLSGRAEVIALGVLIGAVALIPANRVVGPLGSVGVPAVLAGGGLLLLWLYSRCGTTMGLDRGRQPVRVVALLLLVSTLASYAAGQLRGLTPVEESPANAALLILASGMGILLFTSDGVRDMKRLMKVIELLVTGAAFMALVGLLQYYNVFDFAASAKLPGLIVNTEAMSDYVIDRAGLNRVAGTTTHPIELSVVLSMTAPLALNMALFGPRTKRPWNWLLFGLIASVIPLTVSRSGILAVGAALLVYAMILKFRTILSLTPLAISGVAAIVVVAPGVLGTLWGFFQTTGIEPSSTHRTDQYPVVYAQWLEHPLLGSGLGTYLPTSHAVLDNQYLLTLVTTGSLGLLVYIVLLCTGYSLGRRAHRLARDEEPRRLGQALAAGLVAAMIGSYSFDAMSFTVMFVVTHLFVGLAGALWRIAVRDGEVSTGGANAEPARSPNAVGRQTGPRGTGTWPEEGGQG